MSDPRQRPPPDGSPDTEPDDVRRGRQSAAAWFRAWLVCLALMIISLLMPEPETIELGIPADTEAWLFKRSWPLFAIAQTITLFVWLMKRFGSTGEKRKWWR